MAELTTYTFRAEVAAPPDELMAGALRRSLGRVIREGVGPHVPVTVYMTFSHDDGEPAPLPPPKSEAEQTAERILSRRQKH